MIDPITGYLGGYSVSEKYFFIKDMITGILLRKQPIFTTNNYSYYYYLFDNKLLFSDGYYLNLNIDIH